MRCLDTPLNPPPPPTPYTHLSLYRASAMMTSAFCPYACRRVPNKFVSMGTLTAPLPPLPPGVRKAGAMTVGFCPFLSAYCLLIPFFSRSVAIFSLLLLASCVYCISCFIAAYLYSLCLLASTELYYCPLPDLTLFPS